MTDWRKILAAAVAGFVSALVVDVHAWSQSDGDFDWKLAGKRWVAGIVSGILTGFGFDASGA